MGSPPAALSGGHSAGVVEAPDADGAIKIVAERFGYDARRLIAQPIEGGTVKALGSF
jgi:hypothetical protein